MKKILLAEITSYDLLKAFALLTMIVDHVGYYFFIEEEWFRVVGRLSAPVWFFLIGYAESRDLGEKMWGGLILLVAANFVVGFPAFPLNILATMIFIRLVIDATMRQALRDYEALIGVSLIVLFLVLPSMMVWEYGTLGLLFAMYGFMRRRPEALARLPRDSAALFITLSAAVYIGFQSLLFGFEKIHILAFALGMIPVLLWLSSFRPKVYPDLTRGLTPPGAALVRLCGRRTLEFYVLHLVVFKIAALLLGDPRYSWFNLQLFPIAQ